MSWLHEYCRNHHLQMLMWADMLLPEHNGGSPFFLDRAADELPRDIVLCNWSTSLAPLSLWDLHRRGFPGVVLCDPIGIILNTPNRVCC